MGIALVFEEVDNLRTDRVFTLIEMRNVLGDSPLVVEYFKFPLIQLIKEGNLHFLIEVGEFTDSTKEELCAIIKLSGLIEGNREDFRI